MIAQVIVDIAAKQTDHIFEYHIPEKLGSVEIGSRVVVPFGSRKLQGFVVGLTDHTDYQGDLKDLLIVVDELPPLTPELVDLSAYLANEIFSYRISILKAMLPRVMRANYRKILAPVSEKANKLPLFHGDPIDLNEITDIDLIVQIKNLLKNNDAKIEYLVENKAKEKTENQYILLLSKDEYLKIYESLRTSASKQRALLQDIINNYNSYPRMQSFFKKIRINSSVLNTAVKNGWLLKKKVEVYRNPLKDIVDDKKRNKVVLNSEQQMALDAITENITQKKAGTFLLEGVTGSGKTEVYLHAISKALNEGKNALMLVPEISLTPQMVRQVHARFGEKVAVLHSALSEGEKYDEWRRIRRGEAKVVVGARSAIFAPLDNLGIIIIDEEHESSYKQDENPRYNAKNVAIWRSKFHNCPLVMGSATPSLGSRARAGKGVYKLLTLTQRANQHPLPEVNIIDLKHVQFAGSQFDISVQLLEAIKQRLEKSEQIILMLNRRGFASFMLCRNCGFVMKCPNCDLSLTMHKDTHQMQCHYCGYSQPVPKRCPNCQNTQIRFLGTGTQKIQEELSELLPQARILRMDVDTTRRKGSYERILNSFGEGDADILLGTQMIAKGLDFPNVTLVGVINADTGLWIPDYNASERTFQLLTQVAGRAGRADKKGQVLIQTYNPDHYAISLSQTQDYELFYRKEMQMRHAGNYPPYFYTVLISVSSKNEQNAARESFNIKRKLLRNLHAPTIVLGPAPAMISRLKNKYYYQILVKYKKEPHLNTLLHQIQDDAQNIKKYGLTVDIDSEPERIM